MSEQPTDPLTRVRAARAGLDDAHEALRAAVLTARSEGRSWAEVGAVLGVSRQAAFKRFGAPADPRTGGPATRRTAEEVVALAERALQCLTSGDLAALATLMTPDAARLLPPDRLAAAWARAVADSGELEHAVPLGSRHPDGTPLPEKESAAGTLVGLVRLVCEAGEWEGRVASDGDGRVTGVLVVEPGTTGWPF